MNIPRDFTPGLLVSPDGIRKSTPRERECISCACSSAEGTGMGPKVHSSAQAALSCAQPHSLLCLVSASVELLFIFPGPVPLGSLRIRSSPAWALGLRFGVYYLSFIHLFIDMNSYRLHIIQITHSLNHLRESC